MAAGRDDTRRPDGPHRPPNESEAERDLVAAVERQGWTVVRVSAPGAPPFAYSVGMWRMFAAPEIIVVGMPLEVAHQLIDDVARLVRDGKRFAAGQVTGELLVRYDATFRVVPPHQYEPYLAWGLWYYGGPRFSCLQLVYPDREGRWPWDPATDPEFRELQPVLETSAAPPRAPRTPPTR